MIALVIGDQTVGGVRFVVLYNAKPVAQLGQEKVN
jgi:hypothetical protein